MKMRPIQPQSGDILEVVSESPCTNMKVVRRDGTSWALKFLYSNGAVLYVPLPQNGGPDEDVRNIDITLGPATS